MTHRRHTAGFTLLEVLVATAIMGIATVSLMSALTTSLRNASRITETDRAALLARQKMDELLVAPGLPVNSEIDGAWDPSVTGGIPVNWRAMATVFEAPPGNLPPGTRVIERLEVEVSWMDGPNRRSYKLSGYRIARPGFPGQL